MKRHSKAKIVLLLVLVVLGYLAWRQLRDRDQASNQAKAEDPALLFNRVWIDSKPKKLTDYVHALLVVEAVPIGVFQRGSAYRVLLERFEQLREGSALRVRFPQSGQRALVRYRIRACNELPSFDLCLELERNPWDGPRRYYGLRHPRQTDATLRSLEEKLLNAASSPSSI